MPTTRLHWIASAIASIGCLAVMAAAQPQHHQHRPDQMAAIDFTRTFRVEAASRSAPHRDLPDVSPPTTEPPAPPPTIPARTRGNRTADAGRASSRSATPQNRPSPTTVQISASSSSAASGVWACIRARESGGNYQRNSGNGYYGALQFAPATWNASVRGAGYPQYANGRADLAPPAVQDEAGVWLQAHAGWGQWPRTSRMCGVR
jgi:hypothetical protein